MCAGSAEFLRFSELIELTPAHFVINEEIMTIPIAHSKNDQLRQDDVIVIARTRSKTCPVAMLEYYFQRVGMTTEDDRFLFRAIQKTKNGENWVVSATAACTDCLKRR